MKKIPLFQWANKCETEALGCLAADIEQFGVSYNDEYGREHWLEAGDKRVEKALEIVRRAVINEQWRRDGHDEAQKGYVPWDDDQWTWPYEEDTASMFFVTITDDLQYCPPKQRMSASGVRTTSTDEPGRYGKQGDLISAYLLKYFFDHNKDLLQKSPEELMEDFCTKSTEKKKVRDMLKLTDMKSETFHKNTQRFCRKYIASLKEGNSS